MALKIGVPREIKPLERRVGLTPAGVHALSAKGLKVLVQSGAGQGSGFTDGAYQDAGALMIGSAVSLYQAADLVLKVKEPQNSEFPLLRAGQYLFCYLHLAAPENAALVRALMTGGITALAYESLEVGGVRPLLKPMSRIAGGLAAAYGTMLAGSLRSSAAAGFKSTGELLRALEDIARIYPDPPAEARAPYTVIWGGGSAGEKALEFCLRMGGHAALVEENAARREELKKFYAMKRAVFFAPGGLPDEVLHAAELFIGCVHKSASRACRVITDEQLGACSRQIKKVIIDVSIDQGGNFTQSEPRTYEDPVYLDCWGNLRFSVTNMPSLCGPAASKALEEAVLPYAQSLAEDPALALQNVAGLAGAVNVRGGEVILQTVKDAHGLA